MELYPLFREWIPGTNPFRIFFDTSLGHISFHKTWKKQGGTRIHEAFFPFRTRHESRLLGIVLGVDNDDDDDDDDVVVVVGITLILMYSLFTCSFPILTLRPAGHDLLHRA